MNYELKLKIFLFFVFSFWIIFLFSEPWFFSNKIGLISYPFVKKGLNLICHQEEAKLINFYGFHSLVCTRCIGLYTGVWFGLVFSFFVNIDLNLNKKLFALSTILVLSDILFYDYLSIYSYNKIIAFLTGLFLGSAVFNYFWISLNDKNAVVTD